MSTARPGLRDDAPPEQSKKGGGGDLADAAGVEASGNSIVGRSVTIDKPRDELFAFFRNFANLPTFMENVVRIDVSDPARSHWTVKAPAGRTVEWDTVVIDEVPGDYIAWCATEDADVPNSGRVEFRDAGDRGTVVTAIISYDPPGGAIGKIIAKLFQREPAIQARRDLRRFKQLMETGEVATAARNERILAEESN